MSCLIDTDFIDIIQKRQEKRSTSVHCLFKMSTH